MIIVFRESIEHKLLIILKIKHQIIYLKNLFGLEFPIVKIELHEFKLYFL